MARKPILIGVMGLTGAGKSNFIQTITGDENIKIGKRLKSCTQEVRSATLIEIDGCPVQLVDTPGFSDTKLTDTDVLGMIADWMKKSFDEKQKLHGIVLLHCIADTRMHAGSTRCVRLFGDICGKDFLKNTVMVTTMWDKRCRHPDDLEESYEAEVDLLSEHWAQHLKVDKEAGGTPVVKMIGRNGSVRLAENVKSDGSAMYARSYNNKQNCEDIIRKIVVQNKNIPELQKELGEQRKGLGDTVAGAGLRNALDELAKEHKKKMKELEERYQKAMEANETKIAKMLEEERAFQREQMVKNQKDRDALAKKTAEMHKEHKELVAKIERMHEVYRKVSDAEEQELEEHQQIRRQRREGEGVQEGQESNGSNRRRGMDEITRRREQEAQEQKERRRVEIERNRQAEIERNRQIEIERRRLIDQEWYQWQQRMDREWQQQLESEMQAQQHLERERIQKLERERKHPKKEKTREALREPQKRGGFFGRLFGAVGHTSRNGKSDMAEMEGDTHYDTIGVPAEEPYDDNIIPGTGGAVELPAYTSD